MEVSVSFSESAAARATTLPKVASATPATGEVDSSMVARSALAASFSEYEVAAAEKFFGITTTAA